MLVNEGKSFCFINLIFILFVVFLSAPRPTSATTFFTGDVIVGVSGGQYLHYDNAGNLLETLSDGLGGVPTGCAFDSSGNLYTTNFTNAKVTKYDNEHPHPILQIIDTAIASPGGYSESIVFDAAGNFYVGHVNSDDLIHKYDPGGTLLATFSAEVEKHGTDWIELAADQTTMFYTSEGRAILRYDIGANEQLSNFAVLPGIGYAFALRLLPPGDGSGGLLVADTFDIKRLDGSGAVVQTYELLNVKGWFSLGLDPNGTSFWAGNSGSGKFYKFNIESGEVELGPIDPEVTFLGGICVYNEHTAALSTILDPVGGSGFDSLLEGPDITTNLDILAEKGRPVDGVSADGVTQVIIRVTGSSPGESLTFSILDDQYNSSTSTDEDGALGNIGDSPAQSSISVQAVDTIAGPMAFAIYRAPVDYPRNSTDHSMSQSRTVSINITSQDIAGPSLNLPIQILRPPVILIHGIWGGPDNWNDFTPLVNDSRFSIFKVDYDEPIQVTVTIPQYSDRILRRANTNQLGFTFNAETVLDQTRSFITKFKNSQNVASVQADLVTHSMGGDIARTLPQTPNFLRDDTFGEGVIHKLITIGTPHLGTPLATQLLQDANSCVREHMLAPRGNIAFIGVRDVGGRAIFGGVFDLQGDGVVGGELSQALLNIHGQSPRQIPTAMIAGDMSQNQLNGLSTSVVAIYIGLRCNGDPLADNLTPEGWPTIVSDRSDAIVPLTSQVNGMSAFFEAEAVHSIGVERLGFDGPNEFEAQSGIPAQVIELLNTPVTSSSFTCLPEGTLWPCN